jgi:O-antigen ligase
MPFYALVAFTFVLLIAPQTIHPVLGALRIALAAIAVTIVANVWDRSSRGAPLFELPRGAWPAVALGAWALVTAPLSYWPGGSIELFLAMFSKSLIVFLLVPQVVDTRRRLRHLFAFMSILGVVLALTAIQNYLSGTFVASAAEVKKIEGYDAPLTGNPNDLAMMLNLLLPLTWALFAIYKSVPVRIALGLVFAVQVAAIVATFSRAGFLTLAVVWTFHVLRSTRGVARVGVVLAAGVALFVLTALPAGYAQFLGTVTDISSDPTGSAQQRVQLMTAAVGVILEHPIFGTGLGMNVLPLMEEVRGGRHVHNVYLQVGADLGVLGLALFVLLLAFCFKAVRAVSKARENRGRRREMFFMARALELALLAYAFDAFFNPTAYNFYLFYVGGLAFAVQKIHEREMGA